MAVIALTWIDVAVTCIGQAGFHESDEGTPSPEIFVSIVVPEDFVGFACAELAACRGMITAMAAPSEVS
jgi:hypothetical protein